MFLQALYNAAAMALLVLLAVGAFYSAVVLEPFLLPLFWAVLTGFVLFPYKQSLANALHGAIEHLAKAKER